MKSLLPGAVVMAASLVAAEVGGPVVWAAYWGAVLFVISRA